MRQTLQLQHFKGFCCFVHVTFLWVDASVDAKNDTLNATCCVYSLALLRQKWRINGWIKPHTFSLSSFCFQVTEETAQMVESVGYGVTLRGVVNVKGKGELTTYFINTDQSSPQF